MKTAILLVLNLPLMILPAACSRRLPASDHTDAFSDSAAANDLPEKLTAESGLETLRRDVSRMKPPELLETARDCHRTLTETDQAIRPLARRLEAMAMTDRLSPEAQKITAELIALRVTQVKLSKELEVYTSALKAYGITLEE